MESHDAPPPPSEREPESKKDQIQDRAGQHHALLMALVMPWPRALDGQARRGRRLPPLAPGGAPAAPGGSRLMLPVSTAPALVAAAYFVKRTA